MASPHSEAETTLVSPPLRFTPQEWAAIFPSPAQPVPSVSPLPRAADPATGLRTSAPLCPVSIVEQLRGKGFIRAAVSLQFALAPLSRWSLLRYSLSAVPQICLLGTDWWFNARTGTFERAQMAAGTAALAFSMLLSGFLPQLLLQLMLKVAPDESGKLTGVPDLNQHACAGLLRWQQLVKGQEQEQAIEVVVARDDDASSSMKDLTLREGFVKKDASLLLEHRPEDKDCSCPRSSCAGSTFRSASMLDFLFLGLGMPYSYFAGVICGNFTGLFTFGSLLWHTYWWGMLLGLAVVLGGAFFSFTTMGSLYDLSIPLLRITQRMQHRAMSLALTDLLSRYEDNLESPEDTDDAADADKQLVVAPEHELYAQLHEQLTASWRSGLEHLSAGRSFLAMTIGVEVIAMMITAISGSCITATPVFVMLNFFFFQFKSMVILAVSNSSIQRIRNLYQDARMSIRAMILRTNALHPELTAKQSRAVEMLDRHDRVLSSFLEADRYRARFLGFPIDVGVLRTLIVTLFTLAVGLWSVLKGSGLVFTFDNFCHTR